MALPTTTTLLLRCTAFLLSAASLLSHPAVAQLSNAQKDAIELATRSYRAEHHVPAVSLAVLFNGQVVLAQGYGQADVENAVPATADTVYRIASVSKPLTAIAAMKLVEGGKLDLDAPIQKYCPAFPKKQWTITTRQLLAHQSGIRNYKKDEETVSTRHYKSINEALKQFDNDPLEFEPGSNMQYTTFGYVVVGCIIEGASGESYDSYMHHVIFGPAHMPAGPTTYSQSFLIAPTAMRLILPDICRIPSSSRSAIRYRVVASTPPPATWVTSLLHFIPVD
jgi:serine beta-lactamase-like protein LACTB